MISLRYHAVSIAAVFLALAMGVVLGASGVSDRVLSAVSSQRDDLGVQVTRLSAERDALAARDRAADEFASRVGPAAVRGLLAGQTVALVVAGADVQDRDAVTGLIEQAGGTVTGQVELTDAVGDPARADQLRELTSQLLPTGAQLPAASDTGSLVGGLLGGVLLARDGVAAVQPRRRRRGAHRPHQRRFRPARAAAGSGESRARAHRRRSGRGGRRRLRGGLRAARGPARPRRPPARCWPGAADRPARRARSASRGRTRTWWRGSRRWTTCSPARAGWRPCWRCTSSSTAARAATARVRALRRALLRPCLSSPEPDNGAQSA